MRSLVLNDYTELEGTFSTVGTQWNTLRSKFSSPQSQAGVAVPHATSFVHSLYQALLPEAPNPAQAGRVLGGLWSDGGLPFTLGQGPSPSLGGLFATVKEFLGRRLYRDMIENTNQLIALDDSAFVNVLYRVLLCRAPDPDGEKYHLELLRTGTSRSAVIAGIVASREAHEVNLSAVDQSKNALRLKFLHLLYILHSRIRMVDCKDRLYLANSFDGTARYIGLCNNYLYLFLSLPLMTISSLLFNNIVMLSFRPKDQSFTVIAQASRDLANEGEISLQFLAEDVPIYVLSFTIVPGQLVGLRDQHVMLVSRLQGQRHKAPEIRQATKDMRDISPKAVLFAVLHGMAQAMGIDHIAGICAANHICNDGSNPGMFERSYDDFFISVGATPSDDLFNILSVPFPETSMKLVKPGHRLRTRLKRRIKSNISAHVRLSWENLMTIDANYSREDVLSEQQDYLFEY